MENVIRIPKVNKDAKVWQEYGFEKTNAERVAEVLEYGLSTEEVESYAKIHEMGTEAQKEWIENLFEAMNYHAECKILRMGNGTKIIDAIIEYGNKYYEHLD